MIDILVIEPDESARQRTVAHFKAIDDYDAEGVADPDHGMDVFDDYESFNAAVCGVDDLESARRVIKRLRRRRCAIPIVVLVERAPSAEARAEIAEMPMVALQVKPVDIDVIHAALDEVVAESRTMGFQGRLERISLIDMIQLFCQTGKTGRLDIHHWGQRGHVYFGNGLVIHAVQGELDGAEAFYRLVSWESGMFETEFGVLPAIDTLGNESLHGLLIEALRRKDEAARTDELLVRRVEAAPEPDPAPRRLDLFEGTAPSGRRPVLDPDVVTRLLDVEGAEALVVVSRSGTLLQTTGLDADEENQLATLTAFVGSSCEAARKPIRAKRFGSAIVVQSDQRKLLVVNTRNFFLGFVGSQHVNVEGFRHKMLRAVARVASPNRRRRRAAAGEPVEP